MGDQERTADIEVVDIGKVCRGDGAKWLDYFTACIIDQYIDLGFTAFSLEPCAYRRGNIFNGLGASKIGLDTAYSRFVRKRCYTVLKTRSSWVGAGRGVYDNYLKDVNM